MQDQPFIFFVYVTCGSTNASATYSAAIIHDQFIAVGADNRNQNPDGSYDDNTCKLIFTRNHMVFTLLNIRNYTSSDGKAVELPEVAQSLDMGNDKSVSETITAIGMELVRRIGPGKFSTLFSDLYLAGFDESGPAIAYTRLYFDLDSKGFKLTPVVIHREKDEVIASEYETIRYIFCIVPILSVSSERKWGNCRNHRTPKAYCTTS